MKKNIAFAPIAALGLLMGTTAVHADPYDSITTDTRGVSASVSGALQGDTGFLTGGQVQVSGVGQASVNLNRAQAAINVIAGSQAGLAAEGGGVFNVPTSQSSMVTTFDFDRQVNTSGALVGVGTIVAQGESLGGVAVIGNANANATRSGTGLIGIVDAEPADVDTPAVAAVAGDPVSGSSSTPTSAQGSLVGNFSTANTMQLTGTGSLFAGSQALNLGERNIGFSAGKTGAIRADAADGAGITMNTLTTTDGATDPSVFDVAGTTGFTAANVSGAGAGFMTQSKLNGGEAIDINVANAGNGSVIVSASTGGFFGQGTVFGATAAPTFSNANSKGGSGFFNIDLVD